jgi:GDPmannose 4,6-dehydratase
MRRAFITGITGQDGSYLAEYLLAQGYEVWGLLHKHPNPQAARVLREVHMVHGDLLDQQSMLTAIERVQPDEVYNLADISYVPFSWQHAELSARITGMGAQHVLEAIRLSSGITASRTPGSGQIHFFQASTAEMFGNASTSPQNEDFPVKPCTPHGTAKAQAHFTTQGYREEFGMFAACGILYNHESPRRAAEFVSRKITLAVASIKLGHERNVRLGDLRNKRDWGFAGDHVRAMHLMLNKSEPDDYVVGTGVSHSVEELASRAFSYAGLDWRNHVLSDAGLIRPAEPQNLRADSRKAMENLDWKPTITFDELLEIMVEADIELLSKNGHIYRVPSLETW